MSDFERREATGTLFPNDKRETEAQPTHRGECKIEGKVYKISGWKKEGKRGPWLSLALTLKDGAEL